MNNLQKYIIDEHELNGVSYKHMYTNKFNFISHQTFHKMKKTGDITRMSIETGFRLSKITGMSIEEMVKKYHE